VCPESWITWRSAQVDEHAVQKLVDQSVSPLPIGRITFRGLAYEGLEFHAKLINFRGTSSCDPGGENLRGHFWMKLHRKISTEDESL
jgi:hypothetical protein